ncbi:hypothetical protein GCK72_003240 [Caenorhabditis remanei]|uniref:Uncharacterized protein n=1 Tax=Caenorhabditis remanei TaxID=31234 RepID=A0A6A5HX01_CAERE|nr:hypothetical protein GCK72_003240 [Caenorhabditis remanei]KAF1771414.1 hypothetical protein GCK72_003240 [Caenorhabditis remanei]
MEMIDYIQIATLVLMPVMFVLCVKKKSKKKAKKLVPSPPEQPNPPVSPSVSTQPLTGIKYSELKRRQKPMVIFDDNEKSRSVSNAKTPKSRSVEESSLRIKPTVNSNSHIIDSSASVHEKEKEDEKASKAPQLPAKNENDDDCGEDRRSGDEED